MATLPSRSAAAASPPCASSSLATSAAKSCIAVGLRRSPPQWPSGGAIKTPFRVSPDGIHWYGSDDAAGGLRAVLTELAPFSGRRRAVGRWRCAASASAATRGPPSARDAASGPPPRACAPSSDGEIVHAAAGGCGRRRGARRRRVAVAEVQLALNGQNLWAGAMPAAVDEAGVASSAPRARELRRRPMSDDVPGAGLWYLEEAGRAPRPKRCDGAALRRLLPDRLVPAASPWRRHLAVALAAAPPPLPPLRAAAVGSARLALLEECAPAPWLPGLLTVLRHRPPPRAFAEHGVLVGRRGVARSRRRARRNVSTLPPRRRVVAAAAAAAAAD